MLKTLPWLPLLIGVAIAIMLALSGLINHSKRLPANTPGTPPAEQLARTNSTNTSHAYVDRKSSRMAFAVAPSMQTGHFNRAPEEQPCARNGEETPKWTDVYVAWGTIVLAIVNTLLFVLVICQIREARKVSNRQTIETEAQLAVTKQIAQAAIGVELPRLLVSAIVLHRPGVADLAASLQFARVEVSIKNYGRTPAFIRQESIEIADEPFLPETPIYPSAVDKEPDCVIESGDSYQMKVIYREGISHQNISKLLEGRIFLWVYGYIAYWDFLSERHQTGFCARLHIHQGPLKGEPPRWFQDGPDKYIQSY